MRLPGIKHMGTRVGHPHIGMCILAVRASCVAWQAIRDWLDGTAEEWQERVNATPRISVNGGSQVSIGGVVMIDVEGRR
jgi:hypothetical protein